MNHLFSFLMLGVWAVVLADGDKFITKFDSKLLDAVLKNDRILRSYLDCYLEKKKCGPELEELKRHFSDAIKDECENCSDAQKKTIKKVARKVYKDKPEWWQELLDHFDPEKKNREKYQKFIDEA